MFCYIALMSILISLFIIVSYILNKIEIIYDKLVINYLKCNELFLLFNLLSLRCTYSDRERFVCAQARTHLKN